MVVSGNVFSPFTISTSETKRAGNQKWMVAVRPGYFKSFEISEIRKPDVLQVIMTSLFASASIHLNSFCLIFKSSVIASITIQAS